MMPYLFGEATCTGLGYEMVGYVYLQDKESTIFISPEARGVNLDKMIHFPIW